MDIQPVLRHELDVLRAAMAIPLIVNSGARCLKRNRQVGGARDSMHLQGLAADIQWPADPAYRWKLVNLASQRFSGLGFYDTFIHLDMRDILKRAHSSWCDID